MTRRWIGRLLLAAYLIPMATYGYVTLSAPREAPVTSTPALLGAPNGAQPSARDSAGSAGGEAVRLGIPVLSDTSGAPFRLDQAPAGGGGVSTAGLGDPSPGSANPKVQVAMGSGLDPTTGSGGTSPLPSFPATCQSLCRVDVAFPDDEPTPIPSVSLQFVVRSGIASTYGPGWSERWVALPDGPGWRFRVCGAGGCRVLVSTDAGPSLAMQRAGRIVDLPVGAFEAVCGVPHSMGLCQVSLTILGRR